MSHSATRWIVLPKTNQTKKVVQGRSQPLTIDNPVSFPTREQFYAQLGAAGVDFRR